jgi:large subunit ribosomal protein L21
MYAIVEIAGQQFKIEKDRKVYVHRLNAEEGSQIKLDRVMLLDQDGKIEVGNPIVKGVEVTATVLNHLKGDKVLVFKKKRRKSYQKMNGHRQYLTSIKIDDIVVK